MFSLSMTVFIRRIGKPTLSAQVVNVFAVTVNTAPAW